MNKIIFLCVCFLTYTVSSQIKGNITNEKGEPLSSVSIYLEKTVTGTTSNDNGDYILPVKQKGTYTIVFQFLGFKTLKKTETITTFPFKLNIVLEEESVTLSEISISTKDNPANKIIRNVIKNKEKNTAKYSNYTAKFYSRGITRIKNAPKKFLGQSTGDFGGGLDSTRTGVVYLSETFSKISYQKKPKKFKEFIVASKVSGNDNGVSLNRAEESKIDMYENSIAIFNDIISPISTNAFSYYNFKLVGTFYDDSGKLINKIELLPKRKNNRVFNGFIYIVEDDWALYGVDVTTTGAQANIPIVNELKLKQGFGYAEDIQGWVLISQVIDFDIAVLGFKPSGKFSYVYSDYNFEPNFTKNFFTNEVLSFDKGATKKDSLYWNKLRPVPLTAEEIKDYTKKDSIKVVRKSKSYLDSIDGVQNKFNVLSPITGYTFRNSYEKWDLNFDGFIDNFSFNTVQGFNSSLAGYYFKRQNDAGKWWAIGADINYGFSEDKVRPILYFTKKWNNVSQPRLSISGGVTTAQFNGRNPITKLDNTIRSLALRQNFIKLYEKEYAKVSYSEEIKNGVFLTTSLEYANRKPLFNTSDYSFARESKTQPYTSNNPLNPTDFTNAAFNTHAIATLNVEAKFVFAQKYLSYPNQKFNLGNDKFPVLEINYRKRFGAAKKELNSDLFTAAIKQFINAGNYGNFSYRLRGGMFVKQKNIAFMDNLQVNGNQLRFITGDQLNNFGLLEYYKFFTNDKYLEAHAEHNFRGVLLGKIPLLNTLNFYLVTGAKALTMANRNPYMEYYLGLDNLGFGKWRLLRIDYVRSISAGIKNDGLLFRLSF